MIMFEDLELPDMERKILREVMSERLSKRKGYRQVPGFAFVWIESGQAIVRIKRRLAVQTK